jgi:hypothetical protein
MSLHECLKAVSSSLSLAGTAYEPWVQLSQFLLMGSVTLSAIIWVLTRRHVTAAAHQVWSLLQQAGRAYVDANRYPPRPPALERRLTRLFLYGDLVAYRFLGALGVLSSMQIGYYLAIFLSNQVWSWSVLALFCLVFFVCYTRLFFVAASRARYRIKTGEQFIWPMIQPR